MEKADLAFAVAIVEAATGWLATFVLAPSREQWCANSTSLTSGCVCSTARSLCLYPRCGGSPPPHIAPRTGRTATSLEDTSLLDFPMPS